VAATIDNESHDPLIDFRISFEDRQSLKVIEDSVLDLLVIFDSMADTLRELCYQWTGVDTEASSPSGHRNLHASLRDNVAEINLNHNKAKTLLKRLEGTTGLVSWIL
jgi:hypothetical protein